MSDKFSPYIGPDTLRAINKTNKQFFDSFTKKTCGYEDINGSQYTGTVENFGSEVLLESRKMLLDKPSLDNKILINDDFKFYFDTNYSEYVNTYSQQNMLHALLKKDVLLSNIEYRIKFEDVSIVTIPRSMSSSDPTVVKDKWYKTNTPPTLIMNDGENEISLKFTDVATINTVYYFHIGYDTKDLIDADTVTDDSFTTIPINDSMNGYALIWICVDILKTFPYLVLENNVTYNDLPLLTFGNNGHDDTLLFPFMDVKDIGSTSVHFWFIKVIPADETAYDEEHPEAEINYTAKIKEIHFLRYNEENMPDIPTIEPRVDICITYNDEYSKIMLFNEDAWNFNTPVEGDYDYTDKPFKNKTYAYIRLNYFYDNGNVNVKTAIPAFNISFDKDYHYTNKEYTINACSGIQFHNTGDSTDNGTYSKYGVIHGLGDFEGLPSYFTYMIDEGVNREMIALYSIRDKMDDYNQNDTDKCVAGIIIDSGIPKNDSTKIDDDYPIGIKFSQATALTEFKYYFDRSVPIVSPNNILSEITYTDKWVMSNCNMIDHKEEPKFIYHGNGFFSLFLEEKFNPTEIGRVYIISNDPPSYINNEVAVNKKANRTFARICDIPVNYNQLTGIHNIAPTFVIDDDYVRTDCNFSDTDKSCIWNITMTPHFVRNTNGDLIFNNIDEAESVFSDEYKHYSDLNDTIRFSSNILSTELSVNMSSIGTGYTVGSVIRFYIGGIKIEYRVGSVDENGGITGYTSAQSFEYNIPISNFGNDRIKVYDALLISGTGSGCKFTTTIPVDIWNSRRPRVDGTLSNGLCLKRTMNTSSGEYDVYGYKYNGLDHVFEQNQRLVGHDEYRNIYDSYTDSHTDELKDSMLYNLFNTNKNKKNRLFVDNNLSNYETIISKNDPIDTGIDYSVSMNKSFISRQDSYYVLKQGTTSQVHHSADAYEINYMYDESYEKNIIIPKCSDLGYIDYVDKSNTIRFHEAEQVTLSTFNPTLSTEDIIENNNNLKDVSIVTGTKDITLNDFITSEEVIKNNMFVKDIYRTNEIYNDEAIDSLRESYIDEPSYVSRLYIEKNYPNASILKKTNNTKEDYINFIVQNSFKFDINSWYTDHPESTYRRDEISLYGKSGDVVTNDKLGGNILLTSETFAKNVLIRKNKQNVQPEYFFKLDINPIMITDPKFTGYKIRDEYGNDISKYCILVINYQLYYPSFNENDIITWHKFIM